MLYFVVVIFVNRVYQFLREVQRGFERVVLIAKRKAVGRYAFELGQRKVSILTFARCAVLFERHANIFFSEILGGLERRFARERVSDVIERFIFREPKRDCSVIIFYSRKEQGIALFVSVVGLCASFEQVAEQVARPFVVVACDKIGERRFAIRVRNVEVVGEQVGNFYKLIAARVQAMKIEREFGSAAR